MLRSPRERARGRRRHDGSRRPAGPPAPRTRLRTDALARGDRPRARPVLPSHRGAVAPRSRRSWRTHPARSARRAGGSTPGSRGRSRGPRPTRPRSKSVSSCPMRAICAEPREPASLRGDLRLAPDLERRALVLLGTTAGTRSWHERARAPGRGRPPHRAGSPPACPRARVRRRARIGPHRGTGALGRSHRAGPGGWRARAPSPPIQALRVAVDGQHLAGLARVDAGELPAGRFAFQDLDGLVQELLRAGDLAPARVRAREEAQRLAQPERVAEHAVSGDRGDVELLAFDVVAARFGHLRRARRGTWSLRMIGRHELERPAEVAGRAVRVERCGALAREQESARRLGLHVGRDRDPRRARQVERLRVVVGELLGEVRDAVGDGPLQPARHRQVLQLPPGARDLAVRDVADQRVPERVLGLAHAGSRCGWGGPARGGGRRPAGRGPTARRSRRAPPTRPTRTPCRPPPRPAGAPCPRGAAGPAASRSTAAATRAPGCRAARRPDGRGCSRSIRPRSTSSWMNSSANSGFPPERSIRTDCVARRQHGALQQRRDQHRGLAVGERRERQADRVVPALGPLRVPVVQLRTGGAHHHERALARRRSDAR